MPARAMRSWLVYLRVVFASVKVMVADPPQLSVAVAEPVLAGAVESPHCNCLSEIGRATCRERVSKLVCGAQVELLPQSSVAFHVRPMPALPVQSAGVGPSVT